MSLQASVASWRTWRPEVGGLCAMVTFDGSPVEGDAAAAMAAAAAHRGADGTRSWTGPGAALVQQVLLVTGREATTVTRAGGLAAVADARLDNRAEIVPILESAGVLPSGAAATDAEVVVAAHRAWGDASPSRLIGDFAFVIFDERQRRLFAARDPLGMRALYHRVEPRHRVVLATEITQVLAAPGVPCSIDELAIAATVAGPFLPADRTSYAGISQLAPGHALVVDAAGSRTWRYWAADPGDLLDLDDEACAEAFRTTFMTAVAARTETTRPIGIMLSGGMDSGALASCAGWLRERQPGRSAVRTYSWAFSELAGADERSTSDLIVQHYDLAATAIPADDAWPLAPHLPHGPDRDDPFCWVFQGLQERTLAQCRDDGAGTILGGDRGDEVTGDWIFDELGLLLHGRAREALADLRLLASRSGGRGAIRQGLVGPAAARLLRRRPGGRSQHELAPWVPPALGERLDLHDVVREHTRGQQFDGPARSARASRIFMPQGARLAVLEERTRARFGLASGDPFSDRRVVELVLALPQWQVQRRGAPKDLARRAMVGVMPESARRAATKTIPTTLFDRAFRERAVGRVRSLLTGSMAAERGWLDEVEARRAYDHYVATGDSPYDFWWPICVELWLRRWWS